MLIIRSFPVGQRFCLAILYTDLASYLGLNLSIVVFISKRTISHKPAQCI